MIYSAPIQEMLFLFEKVLGGNRVLLGKYSDLDIEAIADILQEVAKISENILVPINKDTDVNPPVFEDGKVNCDVGLKEAYW